MKRELIIGIVAIIAVAALIFGLFYLKGENLFANNRTFYTTYNNVGGLVKASPVKISGLQVGVVTDLTMNKNDPSLIDVKFIISDEKVQLPSTTIAVLASDILGTKSIELKLGDDTKMLQSGDFVLAQSEKELTEMVNEQLLPLKLKTEELIKTIDSTVVTVKTIIGNNTGNLNESFVGLKNAIGSFESMSNRLDTLIARQSGKITTIFNNVNSITANLRQSNNAITRVVTNLDTITSRVAQLEFDSIVECARSAICEANEVLYAINNGDGTLHKLLHDSTLYKDVDLMVDQATQLVENIQDHPNRYLQFAVFGSKDKGLRLNSREEKALRKFTRQDSIMDQYKK